MEDLKNILSYQVYFTSNPSSSDKNLFLTFFFNGNPVAIPEDQTLLPLLSKSTQISENSFRIPNIVDITSNSNQNLRDQYSSFFCVLLSNRKARRKERREKGILIGRSVDSGYFIVGLWPYPFYLESETELGKIPQLLKDLISNPKTYSEVLLLTEK